MLHSAQNEELAQKAYNYATYLLGIKLRTEGELRQRMAQKGFGPESVNASLQILKAEKFVNDTAYAEVYLENLKKYKQFGFFGIKKKLLEKRLPRELVEKVLAEGLSETEEQEIAQRFLAKQKAGLEKLRLASRLAGRGFRPGVISRALKPQD